MDAPSCRNRPGRGTLLRRSITGHPVARGVWRREVGGPGAEARAVAKLESQVVVDPDAGRTTVRPPGRLGEVQPLTRLAVGFDLHPWVDRRTLERFALVVDRHVTSPELLADVLATTGGWTVSTEVAELVVRAADGCRGDRLATGWSARTARRRLTDSTGLSPDRVRVIARVARARVLLHRPGASIAEVAARLGYTDQSHLHRDVVRWTGCTPGEWIARAPDWHVTTQADPQIDQTGRWRAGQRSWSPWR